MIGTLASRRRSFVALIAAGILATLLSGCTGQTTVDQSTSIGNYNVSFSLDPERLNPPQHATLTYGLTDAKTNKPVTKFDTIYGALIHNVIVSRDLSIFQHTYATQGLLDQYSMPTEFPVQSEYYSYTLFKPAGGPLQVLTGTVLAGQEGPGPQLTPDSDRIKDSYGSQFTLLLGSNPIKAGTPTQLAVFATERGSPLTRLWAYLGAPGYLWIVDENGENFAVETGASEGHPMAGSSNAQLPPAPTIAPELGSALATVTARPVPTLLPAQQTAQVSVMETPGAITPAVGYGPSVLFTHTFPHPGLYKIWSEMQYRDQVITVPWVVSVGP